MATTLLDTISQHPNFLAHRFDPSSKLAANHVITDFIAREKSFATMMDSIKIQLDFLLNNQGRGVYRPPLNATSGAPGAGKV
jgi:hypothetical protein